MIRLFLCHTQNFLPGMAFAGFRMKTHTKPEQAAQVERENTGNNYFTLCVRHRPESAQFPLRITK